MSALPDRPETGLFEARYVAFLETIVHLRPQLHRYCARMTGSAMDGEDVMQEALFDAYRKLDHLEDGRSLGPWLFAIAHNRCIDALRRRGVRSRVETEASLLSEQVLDGEPVGAMLTPAVERMVIHLPPKERACLLLKDVFDHSLEEIAPLVDSTVGGVKSALSRARQKLAALPAARDPKPEIDPQTRTLLQLYIDRFNRRDWEGVRALTSADAKLRVTDCFAGRLADSPYFVEYSRPIIPWRMALGVVEGEAVAVIMNDTADRPTPLSLIRLRVADGQVVRIDDYFKTPWILESAGPIALV